MFWGEWEPPSLVVDRWSAAGRLPRFLHEPVWGDADVDGPRANTDPWVFGDAFRYSNCKQLTPFGTPSALQSITRGSVTLPGYINPDSRQSPSGALCPRALDEARYAWGAVRDQVFAAGCVLGVSFPTPRRVGAAEVPLSGSRSC